MTHYYDREWEQAHECVRQLKQLAPSHPGIDALLSNVDLFLQRARGQSKLPKGSLRWATFLAVTAAAVALLALVYVGVIPLRIPLGVSTVHHLVEQELALFAAGSQQVI